MISFDLVKTPSSWAIVLFGITIYVVRTLWQNSKSAKDPPSPYLPLPPQKPQEAYSASSYNHIEPLPNFSLATEPPLKIRPFKPKYHLTMAIESCTPSDLLAFDNTYLSRIALRADLLHTRTADVLAVNRVAEPAVLEFYHWVVGTYLPRRLPGMFTLSSPTGEAGKEVVLRNHATHTTLPLAPNSATQALHLLGTNIDTDFLFLLPIPSPSPDAGKYRLEAFVTCFPSGFRTASKLNLPLAAIHTPVPGYAAKLEKSMDRFFSSLPVGKVVRRCNWSVTTGRQLFALDGNHMSDAELELRQTGGNGKAGEKEVVNLRECVLRCERQTLHRLPGSGALVFAFKTYQYGLEEVRAEGSGEALAAAIEGLGTGNVPGMRVYKKEVVWGEKVKAYLRGQIGIDD